MNRYGYGIFLSLTTGLTAREEGVLRRLLDWSLFRDTPIPAGAERLRIAMVSVASEVSAVDKMLDRYFVKDTERGSWAPGIECFKPNKATWSTSGYAAAKARDGDMCRYCGSLNELVIDHIVPRCQGGGDEPENLAVACRGCNSSKGGRTPEQAGMVLR